jgi:hypothetical protein
VPTTVTIDVNPDGGGDYTSLSAAMAEAKDLTASDEIYVFECASSGTADTTNADITGWTTDATRYVVIQSSGANKHTGAWSTSKYRHTGTITISENYTRVLGLQFANLVTVFVDGVSVAYCIRKGTNTAISDNSSFWKNGKIYNNLIICDAAFASFGMRINSTDSTTTYIENNTIVLTGAATFLSGIEQQSGDAVLVARNNIVKGFGNTESYVGTFASGTDNNTTDGTDSIGTGSNNKTSQTFTFTNEGAGDYSLASGDTGAKDNGTTLAGVSSGFTDDIIGTARPGSGAIDCGCFEFATVAGGQPIAKRLGGVGFSSFDVGRQGVKVWRAWPSKQELDMFVKLSKRA